VRAIGQEEEHTNNLAFQFTQGDAAAVNGLCLKRGRRSGDVLRGGQGDCGQKNYTESFVRNHGFLHRQIWSGSLNFFNA
jgi:hypothetical protein